MTELLHHLDRQQPAGRPRLVSQRGEGGGHGGAPGVFLTLPGVEGAQCGQTKGEVTHISHVYNTCPLVSRTHTLFMGI